MNKQALFCDGTARYVCPLEPEVGETVTLKFRAAKEDNIQIRLAINNELYTMESERTYGAFTYYRAEWKLKDGMTSYYFETIEAGSRMGGFHIMIFVWLRDFPRRIGQKAQLFIRFIRIVFITAIRKMMWRQESISILAITAAK